MSKLADVIRSLLPFKKKSSDAGEFEEYFDEIDRDFADDLDTMSNMDKDEEDDETEEPNLDAMQEEKEIPATLDEERNEDRTKKKGPKSIFSRLHLPKKKKKAGSATEKRKEKKLAVKAVKATGGGKQKAVALGKVLMLFLLMGVFGFLGYKMFGDSGNETAAVEQIQEENLEGTEYVLNQDILKVNPFVKLANFTPMDGNGNPIPNSDASVPSSPAGVRTLPAIPSVSVPANVPQVASRALPSIPSNAPLPQVPSAPSSVPSSAPASSAVTVQGILQSDDGSNMAILSDGSIVSEGDSYQDGRIAYIGGDGIQFDNGNTMKYGDQ